MFYNASFRKQNPNKLHFIYMQVRTGLLKWFKTSVFILGNPSEHFKPNPDPGLDLKAEFIVQPL